MVQGAKLEIVLPYKPKAQGVTDMFQSLRWRGTRTQNEVAFFFKAVVQRATTIPNFIVNEGGLRSKKEPVCFQCRNEGNIHGDRKKSLFSAARQKFLLLLLRINVHKE